MCVFNEKCQFFMKTDDFVTEYDDFFIKYVYIFSKIKALNDGGTAFGENSFLKNDLLKNKCPQKAVFHEK